MRINDTANAIDPILKEQTICTKPTLIIKLYVLTELFPFKMDKRVPFHAKFNTNNIHVYFPHNLRKF